MKNITVVGLGLMGSSLAGAMKTNAGFRVTGVDTNPEAIGNALSNGYIDEGMEAFDAACDVDIIFLCLYPDEILEFIRTHRNDIGKDTIVTDISGIQGQLCSRIEAEAEGICRIGGHPLCGSEGRGHEKASPQMFSGASYILIDTKPDRKKQMQELKSVLKMAGIGRIIEMPPGEHDRRVAVVSHLPHLISSAFLTAFNGNDFEIHGGSFRDLARIADINPDLWTQIIKNNKMNVTEVLDDFMSSLVGLKNMIEKDDYGSVYDLLEKTNEKKRSLAEHENY